MGTRSHVKEEPRAASGITEVLRGREALREFAELRTRLKTAMIELGADEVRLGESDAAAVTTLPLYAVPVREIWSVHISPFVVRNREHLLNLLEEHRVFPEAEVLDLVEVLLVLERLESDDARLAARWLLPPESLSRLAGAWGVAAPRAA